MMERQQDATARNLANAMAHHHADRQSHHFTDVLPHRHPDAISQQHQPDVSPQQPSDRSPAATIMFQGTSSDVGKSLLATALCRILKQDGWRVAPYKSQNMSLNAYVTPDGKEIGRAQGMQADACGIAATTDMNPILLKPSREMSSQVVVHGKPYRDMDARSYREQYLPVAESIVREALSRLRAEYEAIVIEGAGSPAEINLKDRDIVNMRLAAWAEAPVILVADIDRGGVFASVVGTLEILEPHERDRVKGVIINKFRGDVTLLQPGLEWLEARIGKPVLGVVPYLPNLALEDEDSASLDKRIADSVRRTIPKMDDQVDCRTDSQHMFHTDSDYADRNAACRFGSDAPVLDIAVVRLPRISNFTDIDPLLHEPGVSVRYIASVRDFGQPDAVIVPGSKNTAQDLLWMQDNGISRLLKQYAAGGGRVVGICGGYQMLGERLLDPETVESEHGECAGLDLLPLVTTFLNEKRTVRVAGIVAVSPAFGNIADLPVNGYEIHMGTTAFTGPAHSPFRIYSTASEAHRESACVNSLSTGAAADQGTVKVESPFAQEGASTADGKIWGTYVHGILHNDELRHAWLNVIRKARGIPAAEHPVLFASLRERSFDRLADHFREHVDMNKIYEILRQGADEHVQ